MDPNDLEEMLEEIKKNQNSNKGFIFKLHPKFEFHILILFVLNLLSAIITIAFSSLIKTEILEFQIVSLLIFLLLVTIFETIVKMLLYKSIYLISIFTFGIVPYIIQTAIFYVTTLIIHNIKFFNIK